ncbi:MAG: hypothetical protein IMW93_03130 [Thermoanaerobacteraceae bacterium]|nr:hypothetical protein [Thermoanaerobacteraceae bacterium]
MSVVEVVLPEKNIKGIVIDVHGKICTGKKFDGRETANLSCLFGKTMFMRLCLYQKEIIAVKSGG